MSGEKISGDLLKAYKAEFQQMRRIAGQPGKTIFE
jgi:hypothetical protein